MTDPRGRKFTCLRLSITDRCDLRCIYCLPAAGIRPVSRSEVLTYDEIVRAVRFLAASAGLLRVRITGGEPLLRPGLAGLIGSLAALGLEDLALTTNGQLLAHHAATLKNAGLRRVNVSVDTLRPDLYRNLTRGGELHRTLDGIESALAAGLAPVRLNVVLLKGWNDDEAAEFVRFGLGRGLEVRFLELMPVGRAEALHRERFVSMAETMERLCGAFRFTELSRVAGATSIRYRVSNENGGTGVVGFVAPVTRPFCAECGRLRLSATGQLRGCLTQREGIDLRPVLRAPSEEEVETGLRNAVGEALRRKLPAASMKSDEGMCRLGG